MEKNRVDELGREVMDIFRDMMSREMMYLSPLIYLMEPEQRKEDGEAATQDGNGAIRDQERTMADAVLSTDGEKLYYDPVRLLRTFSGGKPGYSSLKKEFLHILAHGMLGHIWEEPEEMELMDAAYDVSANSLLRHMAEGLERDADGSRPSFGRAGQNGKRPQQIEKTAAKVTARTLRDYCRKENLTQLLEQMGEKARRDDHRVWRRPENKTGPGSTFFSFSGKQKGESGDEGTASSRMKKNWQQAMESMMGMMSPEDAERFRQGILAGGEGENIKAAEENRSDYRELLRSYTLLKEKRLEDLEMIDTDWYTLGIELYGNIPIIEFPESSEAPSCDEIVIAIDTSGSCGGETASRFLRETCNMIRDFGIGRDRVEIRILECDAAIQNEIVLHSEEDIPEFDSRKMMGWGGTSFVPVFEHIDKLLETQEMKKVRCLLYLSDTYGDFPKKEPAYDTIFVVPEDELREDPGYRSRIPEWVKLVRLTEDDLQMG